MTPRPDAPKPWRKRTYELLRPYSPIDELLVPGSFLFDGASIPRIVSVVTLGMFPTPFEPVLMRAALAHDWLYWTHAVSREEADELLRAICLEDGTRKATANTIHRAVRSFGGSYWPNKDSDFHWMAKFACHPVNRGIEPEKFGLPARTLELL